MSKITVDSSKFDEFTDAVIDVLINKISITFETWLYSYCINIKIYPCWLPPSAFNDGYKEVKAGWKYQF